jgi:arsenite/tail-anchored protein-transporting ATPase
VTARGPGRPAAGASANAPAFHFFAGKGGVGKTTCAAATALALAEGGGLVLVVSTDPAHSLSDAFGRRLGAAPRRLVTRRGALWALELDADRALARWLAQRRSTLRRIAERGTYLDDEDLGRLLRLSFPGVDELMGLVELARVARQGHYERVVVDTAPTGHALRLLAMPETLRRIAAVLNDMYAKHRFLAESLGRGYRADAADLLIDELETDGRALTMLLRSPERCRFSWVLLPEALALAEAQDGVASLAASNIGVSDIVVNRVTPPSGSPCALCDGRRRAERRVLADIHRAFASLPIRAIPALTEEPHGVAGLRAVGAQLRRAGAVGMVSPGGRARAMPPRAPLATAPELPAPTPLRPSPVASPRSAAPLDILAPAGVRLLVVAGKGGVGKTTVAATLALELSRQRPHTRVLLLSADPAHSLGDVLDAPVGDDEQPVPGAPGGLRVRELDAARAFARTRERYERTVEETFDSLLRGSRFDVAYDREALRGLMDLAPPGMDELFAILSVIEALLERQPPIDLVVLDTAPTGHALRLLEMPAAALGWVHALLAILLKYRDVVGLGDVAADLVATARRLRELIAVLTDPARAGVIAVTRAAELPERETERLLDRLRRLRMTVSAVVVNAVTPPGCRRCAHARRREAQWRRRLLARRPRRAQAWSMIGSPAVTPPPRGVAALGAWSRGWEVPE